MNPALYSPFLPLRSVVPLLCFGLLTAPGIFAQSASNFELQPALPAAPGQNPGAKVTKPAPAAKPIAEVAALPSRFVGTDLEAYVNSIASIFIMASRETDPFGQFQDPGAKPVQKATITKTAQRVTTIQSTPFPEIIRKIQVNTVMPREKRFLIKTRSISQGDRITINFRGKQIPIQVTEVGSRQITFLNPETREIAVLKIEMMPVGMTPGNRGITAPGMESDNPNAPLEIESGSSQPQVP